MAEIMKYDDLKELGADAAVKAAGKYMQKGKDYIVEDGDIIYFKVSTLKFSSSCILVSQQLSRFQSGRDRRRVEV